MVVIFQVIFSSPVADLANLGNTTVLDGWVKVHFKTNHILHFASHLNAIIRRAIMRPCFSNEEEFKRTIEATKQILSRDESSMGLICPIDIGKKPR